MPKPITAESIEQFATSYLQKAEKAESIANQELFLDWAWGAALLLQNHGYYEASHWIFGEYKRIHSAITG